MATSFLFHASIILVCCQLAVSFPFLPPPVFNKTPGSETPSPTTESQSSTLPTTEASTSSTTKFSPSLPPSPSPVVVTEKYPAERSDSFHLSMLTDITLPPNSQTQLQKFRLPTDEKGTGGLEPGQYLGNVQDLDPINGVFTAKTEGVFLVTASVQLMNTLIETPTAVEASTEAMIQEVRVAVCINPTSDNCNEALHTTGVLRGSQTSLAVFGNVHLKRNERISVRIFNKSGSDIIILSSSSFSVHRL